MSFVLLFSEPFWSGLWFQTATETKLTFWYALQDLIHSEPFSWKQKEKPICNSHIWMCNHLHHLCNLWPKCDKLCFTTKTTKNPERVTKVTNSKLWHFVIDTIVTNLHTYSVWREQTLFLFLFEIRIRTALRTKENNSKQLFEIRIRTLSSTNIVAAKES